jgi:hypothetical protein
LTGASFVFSLNGFMSQSKPERRSRKRLPAQVPVSIKFDGGREESAQTRDLSDNGIFLYMNSEVAEGNQMEIVLMLPPELSGGEKRWVCCQASVMRVEPGQKAGQFGVAASIQQLDVLPEILG